MSKARPWWRRIWDALTGNAPAEKNQSNAPTPAPAATKQPQRPTAKPSTDPYVYVTKTGKKFHYSADCQALQNAWARNEVIKMGLPKARASGRTACNRCCWEYLH